MEVFLQNITQELFTRAILHSQGVFIFFAVFHLPLFFMIKIWHNKKSIFPLCKSKESQVRGVL